MIGRLGESHFRQSIALELSIKNKETEQHVHLKHKNTCRSEEKRKTTKPRFSRLLRHRAEKRSRPILTTMEPGAEHHHAVQ